MSYRVDFFRMLEGKTPVADVPFNKFFADPGEKIGVVGVMPSICGFGNFDADGKNVWGVPHEIDVNGTGYMPAPGQFILPDVTKWRDIIKAPYQDGYDWEKASQADLANFEWDPETQVTSMFGGGGGYFLQLASFMGFEGAMLAMYDEPDALHELLDYLCDYDIWMVKNLLKYYPMAEVMGMGDDNATELNPFVSMEHFREFLLPRYKRVADLLKENGKIVSYHNCGRCEDFMDDMVGIGVQIWNSATPVNDLLAFKEKYDNKIILEIAVRFFLDATEEQTRQKVRDTIDKYAPGGAFVWMSGSATMNADQGGQVDAWVYDEVDKYGKGFYLR
ncbi:MAG: hypothetical protein LBG68_01800 [Coriobacteriales bacterium]|nr:hypothetical protein [Coriobacteriales bacterium]